jgi:diguanylate cyclase
VKSRELIKKSTNECLGSVTLSLGIAQFRVGEWSTDFISRADQYRYMAKAGGRDNVFTENTKTENQSGFHAA